MTTALVRQAVTLEDEVQALANEYKNKRKEGIEIIRSMGPRMLRYRLQGGTHEVAWLKGLGWSHGTAVNMNDSIRALDAGFSSDSLTELATMGRHLKRGKSKADVVALTEERRLYKAQTEELGIGLNTVRYPTESAPEMVGIVKAVIGEYIRSDVTVPELPELTLAVFRLARQNLTLLPKMEGAPEPAPRPARLDPYAWLAEQPGPCDVPRCAAPWHHLHHLALTDHARRGHPAARLTILRLCSRHHLTGDASAVHGPEGEQAFLLREFGGREYALEIVLFRTAEYAEYLNGGTP